MDFSPEKLFSVSMFFWISSAHVHKNSTDTMKNAIDVVLLCLLPCISLSTPWLTKHKNTCHQQYGFIPYIYIISLQSVPKFDLTISNKTWEHVFRSEVGLYVPCFWSLNWFIFLFLSYVEIFHLIWICKVFGIHYELIPEWIGSTLSRIFFPYQ